MNIAQGNLNKNSINYCVKKLISILEKNPTCQVICFKHGLNRLSYFQLLKKLWATSKSNYHLKYSRRCFSTCNSCHLWEKICNKSVQCHQSWWWKQVIWVQSLTWFFVSCWLDTRIGTVHSPARKQSLCSRERCNICTIWTPPSEVHVVALEATHCNLVQRSFFGVQLQHFNIDPWVPSICCSNYITG